MENDAAPESERLPPVADAPLPDIKDSPVLKRLIEEVRLEKLTGRNAYNRVYNRHMRS